MDAQDIEANIKSLLGLSLGGGGPGALGGGGPPGLGPNLGHAMPPGLMGMGPPGLPPMPVLERGQPERTNSDGIITIESESPVPLPAALRAELDAEEEFRRQAQAEAAWPPGGEDFRPTPATVAHLETR